MKHSCTEKCTILIFRFIIPVVFKKEVLTYSNGVHILLRPHQTESTHPHSTEALDAGTSPTPDFSYSKPANQPDTPRFYTPATHTPLPCQAQYRPHMNHTMLESPGIPQQPQQNIFSTKPPIARNKTHWNSPKLQHRTKHPSPRTSRPQTHNHPPDSNMSLTIDCNNEISLPII
jgi:hypothetical protein